MKTGEFNMKSGEFLHQCLKILIEKGKKYNNNKEDDRLAFFNTAGNMINTSPERALYGMALKHLVSIQQMLEDIDENKVIDPEYFDEKIGDFINYMVMLRMQLWDRYHLGLKSKENMKNLANAINGVSDITYKVAK